MERAANAMTLNFFCSFTLGACSSLARNYLSFPHLIVTGLFDLCYHTL